MKIRRIALLLAAAAAMEYLVGGSRHRSWLPIDWFLLATAAVARGGDFVRAVLAGTASGLMEDTISQELVGLNAFAKAILGYALTIVSLTLGFVTMTTSVPLAIGLIGLSTFIGGGFQMVALKVGSYAFPREQSALMSGIASGSWSLVNFILLNAIGAGVTIAGVRILPGANLISGQRWEEIFWIIALMPLAGVAVWMALSRNQTSTARA